MRERPLLWSALAFAAGLLAPTPDLPAGCWAAWAAASFAGAMALAAIGRRPRTLRRAGLCLAAGFACAGRLALPACDEREPFDVATLLDRHADPLASGVAIEGRLAAAPRRGGPAELDLLFDIGHLTVGSIRMPARGRVRARLPIPAPAGGPVERLRRGALLDLFARLSAPRRYGNDGAFDYPRFLKARGIDALGSIKSGRLIRERGADAPTPAERLMRRVDRLRESLLDRIDRAFPRDAGGRRAAAVSAALLLGEREGIGLEEESLLQDSGLSHLLAVSGFNVAVLAVTLLIVCRGAGLASRGAALSVIPCLVLYLFINREESSVERAVIMAVAALAARAIWRKPDSLNVVGLSALAILVRSPLQIFDSGFQLTYAATIALIVLVPRLVGRGSSSRGRRSGLLLWTKSAVAVTVAVWIGTFPLTLLDFNRIAPGSLPANLVAGPLMAAAFLGVLAIEIAGAFWWPLAQAVAWVVRCLVDLTFLVADAVRSVPMLSYRRITPAPALLLVYYGALGLALIPRKEGRPGTSRRLAGILAAAGSALLLLAPLDTRLRPEGLRITAFDVGQGDSTLVETPAGTRILVDSGGLTRGEFDAGERIVAPALWRLGIARLDRLVVTHADADHAGGAAAIVRSFRPSEVWVPAGAASWPDLPAVLRLREALRETGAPLRQLAQGDEICLRAGRVEVLNPPRWPPTPLAVNDASLVLGISWRGRRILMPADAGAEAEAGMPVESLAADVLKVGHHGSATATSERFARTVAPRIAIVSCGTRNRFGHPDPGVVERLERTGARICRTDRDGAISVDLVGTAPGRTRLGPSCALSWRRAGVRERRR